MPCKGLIYAIGKEANAHLPLQNIEGLSPGLLETPRILFSVAVMVKAGLRQILIGARPECVARLHALIGAGQHIGAEVSYLLLEPDSTIEQALHAANRYIANASVLLATPGVCCLNFHLERTALISGNAIASFRMRSGEQDAMHTRPDLLLLGKGALIRLNREAERSVHGSTEVDQLRRALMARFKYQDVDLTAHCVFANFVNDIKIDSSRLNEAALQTLLTADSQQAAH